MRAHTSQLPTWCYTRLFVIFSARMPGDYSDPAKWKRVIFNAFRKYKIYIKNKQTARLIEKREKHIQSDFMMIMDQIKITIKIVKKLLSNNSNSKLDKKLKK